MWMSWTRGKFLKSFGAVSMGEYNKVIWSELCRRANARNDSFETLNHRLSWYYQITYEWFA